MLWHGFLWPRRPVLSFLLKCLLLYIASALFLFAAQRHLMYFPQIMLTAPQDMTLQPMKAVSVRTSDGLDITGWFHPPADPDGAVFVIFHGNAGTLDHSARKAAKFVQPGQGAFLAGYRGFSGNAGKPGEQGLYRDARAALDWLIVQGYGAQIVLYGESLGSGVAVQMASEYDARGLILEAPFSSAYRLAASKWIYKPYVFLMKDRYESDKKIASIGEPLLIMHGARDAVVPLSFGRDLYAAANQPKTFFLAPEGHHTNSLDLGGVKAVQDFTAGLYLPSEQ